MKLQLTRGILLPIGVLLPVRAATLGHSVPANANYMGRNSIWRSPNEVGTGAPSRLLRWQLSVTFSVLAIYHR